MPTEENYRTESREIVGVTVSVTSYAIEGRFYCHIANVDAGATIARAEDETREAAINLALQKATKRLSDATMNK